MLLAEFDMEKLRFWFLSSFDLSSFSDQTGISHMCQGPEALHRDLESKDYIFMFLYFKMPLHFQFLYSRPAIDYCPHYQVVISGSTRDDKKTPCSERLLLQIKDDVSQVPGAWS